MNFALITVDSLRADHVGCYGYRRNTTPNIDEWATRSHVFTDAVSHACATRPSFPSLMTSTHGMLYGGFDHLSERQTPVAERFAERGYTTGGFHSNPYLSSKFGYGRGFDTFSDLEEDPSLASRLRRYVSNNISGPLHELLSWAHTKVEERAGVDVGSYYQNATALTDEALQWVTTVDGPWFLWVHYMDPHHPYVPPAEHQRFGKKLPQRRGVKLRQKVLQNPDELTDADWSDLVRLYDSEIRYVDAEIGRLLDTLDDVLWILTADHGEEFYEHGDFGHKNRFYEEHIHVPLIFNGGGAGTHDHLVGLNDVPVTLLQEADIPVPETYRGKHIMSGDRTQVIGGWGEDRGKNRERARFMSRTAGEKYIQDLISSTEEVYDLVDDPSERNNILGAADTKDHERNIASFRDEIRRTAEDGENVDIGEDLEEHLRQLGYRD